MKNISRKFIFQDEALKLAFKLNDIQFHKYINSNESVA